ncbi:Uncharacterised protein [Mycobacteroides abscessus subsp. bolletii]|uniref:hypothetical protein n=1 Tax=Mycobacteroides abscessus TaxID=36809 RepID=UPI000926C629|nr:hypothetical protein [Mycobacteroides abscessus]SIJ30634.1 Uncharacterised protein [Mycobacteroides abscessus subsp. bolletii]SLF73437.1 Uncharacterised protein [Mycobacteroides abscessus subsp. bolletii]
MTPPLTITATIDGKTVPRDDVEKWEARRAKAVLKKFVSRLGPLAIAEIAPDLNIDTVLRSDLDTQRRALLTIKTGLGHAGIYAMFRRELAASVHISRAAVAASRGRAARSITEIIAPGVDAGDFAAWFNNLTALNDEINMLDAMPDHYLLRRLPDGRQEVVETTGGSPTPTRFLVDYTTADRLTTTADPSYPIQIAGHAQLDDGLVIGGVRHQLRDNGGTLEARLTVEFPGAMPAPLVAAHRWHLAVEFSNWIIAYHRQTAGTPA